MQILKPGVLYFGFVFGVGFVLGTIRALWIVPRLGTRLAELMEAPICSWQPSSRRGGWLGVSPPPHRRHGLASVWSRWGSCLLRNSRFHSGFAASRFASTLQPETPVAGGGVHRDARRFCRDAASRGSKMRSPLRSGSCEPGIRFPVVMLIDTYLPKFDARGYYETHVDYPCDS
jgi:hypothetical protein